MEPSESLFKCASSCTLFWSEIKTSYFSDRIVQNGLKHIDWNFFRMKIFWAKYVQCPSNCLKIHSPLIRPETILKHWKNTGKQKSKKLMLTKIYIIRYRDSAGSNFTLNNVETIYSFKCLDSFVLDWKTNVREDILPWIGSTKQTPSIEVSVIYILIKLWSGFKDLIKGALWGRRELLTTESPLKIMKTNFNFTLKALFVPKYLNFCLYYLVM